MGTLVPMAKGLLFLSAATVFALAPPVEPESSAPLSSKVVQSQALEPSDAGHPPRTNPSSKPQTASRPSPAAPAEVATRSPVTVDAGAADEDRGIGGSGPSAGGAGTADAGDASLAELQAMREQLAQSQSQLESLNAYARQLESQVTAAQQAQQQDRAARAERVAALTQAVQALEYAQVTLYQRGDPTLHLQNAVSWLANVPGPEADAARKLTAFALDAIAREDGYAAMVSAQQAAEAINVAAQAAAAR